MKHESLTNQGLCKYGLIDSAMASAPSLKHKCGKLDLGGNTDFCAPVPRDVVRNHLWQKVLPKDTIDKARAVASFRRDCVEGVC